MSFTSSDYIAIYAAVLSTVLALSKLVSFIRGYYRVSVLSITTSSSEIGNAICIYNLSDKPITLVYWELEWHHGRWFRGKIERISSPEFDISAGRRIDEYGSTTLPFTGDNYFQTSMHEEKGKKLYIRLYFAGKTHPKLKRVK